MDRLERRGLRKDSKSATARRVPVDTDVLLIEPSHEYVSYVVYELTPDADIILVSQALFVTFTFSMPCSFFAGWPKTWLNTIDCDEFNCSLQNFEVDTNRYFDALTNLDIRTRNTAM